MGQYEIIGAAIDRNFTTPNECDSNLEPANVADGLYAIARAINRLADTLARVEALKQEGST